MLSHPVVDPILGVLAAAEYCHRHPQTLRKEVKRGNLSCLQACPRGRLYFRQSHLDQWLSSQERLAGKLEVRP